MTQKGKRQMADAKNVGQRLKTLRTMLGLTELLMAQRVKGQATTWNAAESGEELLPLPMAEKLVATTPGLTLDWIYRGTTAGLPTELLRVLEVAKEA
jgi:transcriptional regulator with XRE-family HTH domain